ncbi:MAG: shikimate kinase [Lachnospiraceae bacterium]|nr:shikimate kinase [Lachnospiraceae bacterium]
MMKENIVLSGMPGCGKTTVGRALSELSGRGMIDVDEEIVRACGMEIREIFSLYGEAWFREKETDIIEKVSESRGVIIATGGGSVLRAENVEKLKQKGYIFFLDRPLEMLQISPERPIADSEVKLRALYEERMPIYAGTADKVVPNRGTVRETCEQILKDWTGLPG